MLKRILIEHIFHTQDTHTDRLSGGGRRQNSLLNYYDVFSYPSLVVILNKIIRNEQYDQHFW